MARLLVALADALVAGLALPAADLAELRKLEAIGEARENRR
jgi:hypothetical protein